MVRINISEKVERVIKEAEESSPDFYATSAIEDLVEEVYKIFDEKGVKDKIKGVNRFYIYGLSKALYPLLYTMFCLGYYTEITFRKREENGGKD